MKRSDCDEGHTGLAFKSYESSILKIRFPKDYEGGAAFPFKLFGFNRGRGLPFRCIQLMASPAISIPESLSP